MRPTQVKFYYDHKSHWVTDNFNSIILVATGDFQSELGCKQDNDPACLRSWLQDPEGDGLYTFATTQIPAGTYQVSFAVNENMKNSYGTDGKPGGAPISFTVKQDGDEVYFGLDPQAQALTISTEGAPRGNIAKQQAMWVNARYARVEHRRFAEVHVLPALRSHWRAEVRRRKASKAGRPSRSPSPMPGRAAMC